MAFLHILVETIRLVVNTERQKIMTRQILLILERLAEMFPGESYQTRLEQYINSRRPTSNADIELWEREYWQRNSQGAQR